VGRCCPSFLGIKEGWGGGVLLVLKTNIVFLLLIALLLLCVNYSYNRIFYSFRSTQLKVLLLKELDYI